MTRLQQIIEAVEARLMSITQDNGYYTDIGYNVFTATSMPLPQSKLPAIVYHFGAGADDEMRAIGLQSWVINVEIAVLTTKDLYASVINIIADIFKAIGEGAKDNWGGLADEMREITFEINPEEVFEKIINAGKVKISILYSTELWRL